MRFRLIRCLAKAVVKHGVKFVLNLVPGGEALYEIAAETYETYAQDERADALRAEVQELAQAPAEQVRQEVLAAVQAEAAGLPPQTQEALTAYLTQVPPMIRRSLRRSSDPRGTTVPATLALSRPEDLMPFLPPRPPRFKPGDRPLPGVDWVLEELVGIGGFGEVWKARHAHLRSAAPVALKFCLDASALSVLRNEAGVLDRVMQHGRHKGIVPLLHTYLSADPPCLEYEYVEGGDLAALIQDLHATARMTTGMANRLLLHLVEIVAFAHQAETPIVHGDLKPANVLVRRGADGKVALRVTDFGIGGLAAAKAVRETRQPTRSRQELMTEAVRGAYTPLYASPEQVDRRRGEPADLRDDVHALGVIWLQMLTGDLGMIRVPPDWREQVEERGLDDDLVKLLAACLASKAAKRPASAAVLVEQLRAALPAPTRDREEVSQEKEEKPARAPAQRPAADDLASHLESALDDCQEFCKKLGQKDGKRYRLPTEAEWEYACRAGTTTAYHSGNDLAVLKRAGWCSYDGKWGSAKETRPIGQFQSNGWGLYDMHGNVWEWCQDWDGPYPSSDIKDPQGSQKGDARVLRGGSWCCSPRDCRSARRFSNAPSHRRFNVGCRVVLCLD